MTASVNTAVYYRDSSRFIRYLVSPGAAVPYSSSFLLLLRLHISPAVRGVSPALKISDNVRLLSRKRKDRFHGTHVALLPKRCSYLPMEVVRGSVVTSGAPACYRSPVMGTN